LIGESVKEMAKNKALKKETEILEKKVHEFKKEILKLAANQEKR
jgi:hypothetical protein